MLAYYVGRRRAVAGALAAAPQHSHSLPGYHGGYVALWCALPAVLLLTLWQTFEPDVAAQQRAVESLPDDAARAPGRISSASSTTTSATSSKATSSRASPGADITAAAARVLGAAARLSRNLSTAAVLVLGTRVPRLGLSARAARVSRAQSRRARDRVAADRCSLVAVFTTIGIFAVGVRSRRCASSRRFRRSISCSA